MGIQKNGERAFEKDIFISYAHKDNQPLDEEEQGWVTRFDDNLKNLVERQTYRDVKIWRDDTLKRNEDYGDEIVDQLRQTALLVSVVVLAILIQVGALKKLESSVRLSSKPVA